MTRKGGNLRANEQNSSKRMRILQFGSLWAFSSILQTQKATGKNSYTFKFLPILSQPLPAEAALTSQLRGKDHDQR